MPKIHEDVFNSVAEEANLQEKKLIEEDIQRYVMVYDVPKHWLNQLKKNKLKIMKSVIKSMKQMN